MNVTRTLVLMCALLSGTGSATGQVLPGVWVGWGLTTGCAVCAYDAAGNQIAGFPAAGVASFPAIIKHMDGLVYAFDSTTQLLNVHTLTTTVVSLATPGLTDLAVLPSGDFVALLGPIFAGQRVDRFSVAGGLVSSTLLPTLVAQIIRADSAENTWVLDFLQRNVYRIDPAGFLQPPVSLNGFSVGTPTQLEIDARSRAWVLAGQGATATLVQIDRVSGVSAFVTVPDAVAFDIDVCGRLHVLRTGAGGTRVDLMDADTLAVVGTIPLSSPGALESLVMDTAGRYWISSRLPGSVTVFESDGTAVTTISQGIPVTLSRGDAAGVHLVMVDPLGDADRDGVINEDEARLGSDPVDPLSVPPALTLLTAPVPGMTFRVGLSSPSEPGRPYRIGLSGGTDGIPLPSPDCRVIPLSADSLLAWWFNPTNTLALGNEGALDGAGSATLMVTLPTASLGGVTVFFGGVTLDSAGVRIAGISPPLPVVLP
jgi:hypothetical protein